MPDSNNVDLKINIQADTSQAEAPVKKLADAMSDAESQARRTREEVSKPITANTSSAVQEISKFKLASQKAIADFNRSVGKSNSFSKQQAAASKLGDSFRRIGAMETIESARGVLADSTASVKDQMKAVRDLQGAYRDLGNEQGVASSKTKSFLGNLTSSLKRIAKLRVLRGIIRSVTQGISEGSQNLYAYSQAMGSVDAANFANTMNQVASTFLYVKNAIGSVVAPIMNILSPALTWIAEKFVAVANIVAQFFAALGGKTSYTRAKYVETAWQGIADTTGDATANAKEYKRTIMGFDELNVLDSPDEGGGGSGGGGGGGASPSEMFEEVPLEKTGIAGLLNSIGELLAPVIDTVGFLISDFVDGTAGLINGLATLIDGFATDDLEKVRDGLDDIQETLSEHVTMNWGFDSMMDKGKGALTILNDIKTAFVDIGIWAVENFPWLFEFLGYDPNVLLTGLKNIRQELELEAEQIKASDEAWRMWADGAMTQDELTLVLGHIEDGVTNVEDALILAKLQLEEFYDSFGMADKIHDFAEEMENAGASTEEVHEAIKDLAKEDPTFYGILEATGDVDKALEDIRKGSYKVKDGLIQIGDKKLDIKSLKDLASLNDGLVAVQKKAFLAKDSVKDLGKKTDMKGVIDSVNKTKTPFTELQFLTKDTKGKIESFGKSKPSMSTLNSSVRNAKTPFNEIDDKVKGTKTNIGNLGKYKPDTSNVVNKLKGIGETADTTSGKVKGIKDKTSEVAKMKPNFSGITGGMSGISSSADTTTGKIGGVGTKTQEINNWQLGFWGIRSGLGGIGDSATWSDGQVGTLFANLQKLNGSVISFNLNPTVWDPGNIAKSLPGFYSKGGYVGSYAKGGIIPRFANGGVQSAEIFAANENGVPELIGRIGNRPAVANQGQMVDALSEALYRGLSQMFNQESTNEVNVYMDSTRVARAVEKGKRTMNRRFNVALV